MRNNPPCAQPIYQPVIYLSYRLVDSKHQRKNKASYSQFTLREGKCYSLAMAFLLFPTRFYLKSAVW